MLILRNGSEPLMWSVKSGVPNGRNYLGVVLAKWAKGGHPFVVWTMHSDDGRLWDCERGSYCDTIRDATQVFANRAEAPAARNLAWLEQLEEETTNTKEVTVNE